MTDRIIIPGYTYKDLGPDGGAFDEVLHPKIAWHTMETMNVGAAESAYHAYPPHLGVRPPWPGQSPAKNQYIGLNRHSYAFSGSENDDEYVIQVEVAGFAKDMRNAPQNVLEWLVVNVMIPIETFIAVPRVAAPQGFHDTQDVPAGNGPLATSTSKIRFSATSLRAFSGHMGHQHAPSPDKHWDPGALPIQRMFDIAALIDDGPNHQEDEMHTYAKNDEDDARGEIRADCALLWGKGKMTVKDQNWLLGIRQTKGYEAYMTALTDHAKAK